jgi:hypothetical protein
VRLGRVFDGCELLGGELLCKFGGIVRGLLFFVVIEDWANRINDMEGLLADAILQLGDELVVTRLEGIECIRDG